MKKTPSILPLFYLFFGLTVLFLFLASTGNILYVCKKVEWLEWTVQSPYPTVFDFLLLFGIPFWFGKRTTCISRRSVLLYGMGLNLGLGVVGNIISALSWRLFLMKCMPDKYTYDGFQIVMIASWLALPIAALLGGVAALVGHKRSKANPDKKGKQGKKRSS